MNAVLLRTAVLLLAVAGSAGTAAAERLVLTQSDIQKRAMVDPFSFEKAMQTKSTELASRIHALRADTAAEPVLREKLLTDSARALGGQPRTPAGEAALRALSKDAPVVFVKLDDAEHEGQVVPAFDPGAMARFALGEWVRHEARDATQHAFAAGAATLTGTFDADGEARLIAAGIKDAVESSEPATLRRNREALKATLAAGYPVEDAVATAALALEDAALAKHLFEHGDPARTVHHLAALTKALPPSAAVDLLERIDQPELASAALMALGRLAATEPRARSHLLAKLADARDGGSAAAALAAQHDAALAPTLAAAARNAPNTPAGNLAAKRAALALFLDGSPAARRALATLADDPRVGREARHWLAALPPPAPL